LPFENDGKPVVVAAEEPLADVPVNVAAVLAGPNVIELAEVPAAVKAIAPPAVESGRLTDVDAGAVVVAGAVDGVAIAVAVVAGGETDEPPPPPHAARAAANATARPSGNAERAFIGGTSFVRRVRAWRERS
jgi:hypothetical protein